MKQAFSPSHKKFLQKIRRNTFFTHFFRILLLILLFLLWEIIANSGLVDPFITSSPSRIINALSELFSSGNLIYHSFITLYETLLAFLISTIIGFLLALLLYIIPSLRKIIEPYLVVLNSLPKVALGPLIIVWIGAGTKAIIAMGVLICVIVTTISILNGFLEVSEEKILLFKTLGAKHYQILFRLILPASLPNIISVLKINVGLAWVGVIMGEYLNSSAGLGYLIVYGGQIFKLDLVMASILVLCLLASIMYFIIAGIELLINRKRNK
ncbi:MAG: ABC transporter permease [Clostridia bacterium]|nr:ABC transporter permease [Clostridia bacterium]